VELPFAGHPTLGSAHALLSSGFVPKRGGTLVQECGVGLVRLTTSDDGIRFAMPDARFQAVARDIRTLLDEAIGASVQDTPAIVDIGIRWLTAPVASGELLRSLHPNMAKLAALALQTGANGINLFGLDGDTVEVRSFAPHEGTNEDPVCGSGNGAVAYYLRERRGALDYRARQGRCVGRDGHISVAHEGGTIWLGGHAVNCIEGMIQA
ncbi:MAG: PhzF family phenazine biosynthesis protein, partial [Noviherbaspirillum sp.]